MKNCTAESGTNFMQRIRNNNLRTKVRNAADTIPLFKNGMYLAFSGFVEGHPKTVPALLADHVESNCLMGKMRFKCFTAASIGVDLDDRWSALGMIERRWPFQLGPVIRRTINQGKIKYGDTHLSTYAQDIVNGFYTLENEGKFDIAIIEASCITDEGCIVPTLSCGAIPEILSRAEKVIIEINTSMPSFEGMHDLTPVAVPPNMKPYSILRVYDRIGTTSIPCDPNKIVAIVESTKYPKGRPCDSSDPKFKLIAAHIIDFFKFEVKQGRLPANLLPIQSGGGIIANAVLQGLLESSFTNLNAWTEVVQDGFLDLIDAGKLDFISACGYALTDEGLQRFFANKERYAKRSVLRQATISNHPEMIRRLGLICMNTPVEFDIYAHVNSTMVNGSSMLNGIGGSGDFMRNGYLSIMHTPSTMRTKTDINGISCVLPMVTHVDHTEHDMNVLVTEQGLADLRGLTPTERAQRIIDKCVHPDYKPILQEYFDRSTRECLSRTAAHEPHMLHKVFNMQRNLSEKGTMKIENWD